MTNTLMQPTSTALLADAPRFRHVALPDGETFACDVAGPTADAPVVVLLHGLMATGALNWAPFIDDLAAQYRVVALDHRGHGRGIVDGTPFTLEQCADDVAALLDVLGVDQAILVGYSMGGPIAQLTWRRHSHVVRGMVLCATATSFGVTPFDGLLLPVFDPVIGGAGKALAMLPPQMRSLLTQPALGLGVPDPTRRAALAEALRSHHLSSIRAAVRSVLAFDSATWIGGLSVPASVIVTERDRVVSPARQRALVDLLPDMTDFRIDADHLACFTNPDIFGTALAEAIDSVVSRISPSVTTRTAQAGRLRARWHSWRARRAVRPDP